MFPFPRWLIFLFFLIPGRHSSTDSTAPRIMSSRGSIERGVKEETIRYAEFSSWFPCVQIRKSVLESFGAPFSVSSEKEDRKRELNRLRCVLLFVLVH